MNEKRKVIISIILGIMLLTLGSVGLYYWYNNTHFVSTEDAKVTGDFIKVTPGISGKLLELNVKEGSTYVRNQIVGRIDANGISDSSMNTTLLRAPISGLVVKKQSAVGEFIPAGSTLAVMVDPGQLYICANIQETKLESIKPGETVDIKIDQYGGKSFSGKVDSIGQVSNSAFSLLPSSSGGTFTKVVQTVPVKIVFDKNDAALLPGTNAVVKIHVK